MPAQYDDCDSSLTLKPVTSCSMPNTRTLFALRPAGVLGTFAQDCANGAAASLAELDDVVVALALAPRVSSATAAPATSRSRLCIGGPPFVGALSRACTRLRLGAHRP